MIPVFRPSTGREELDSVAQVLESGWLGLGPKTEEFERRFARYLGVPHVVGLSSGTAALDLATVLLDIGPGDEVLVPALSFVSNAHVVCYRRAKPVFVDIDPDTLNISLEDVARKITPKTRAVMVVHFGGLPVDVRGLREVVGSNVPIIEDCAHAAGARYYEKRVGSEGNLSCFSFHAVKNLAMGDGGALIMNRASDCERVQRLRWMGIDRTTWDRSKNDHRYTWKYDVPEIGYKCHMNDLSAAVGLVQLQKLDTLNERRRQIAKMYHDALEGVVGLPPEEPDGFQSSCHIFFIKTNRRDALAAHLADCGVSTSVHYHPLHQYECYGAKQQSLPVAESVSREILTLPLFPDMTESEVTQVVTHIRQFFGLGSGASPSPHRRSTVAPHRECQKKVSVLMVTYNQRQFVAQALQSAVQQETDFDYEIVVGDDWSTDGTREIIHRLQSEHGDKIRILHTSHHLGMHQNMIRTYEACRGQYLAILEGDDYWTSPHKLQRQVDFLDNHEECVTCFHNAIVMATDASQERLYCPPDQKQLSTIEDILQENFIPTCSVMCRSGLIKEIPAWAFDLAFGDWPFHVLCACHGAIGYINDTLAVYRRHEAGVWTTLSNQQKADTVVAMYRHLNDHLGSKYDALIASLISKWKAHFKFEQAHSELQQTHSELEQAHSDLAQLGERTDNQLRNGQHRLTQLGDTVQQLLVPRIRDAVQSVVPPNATVLVASTGDENLIELDGTKGWHFPQTEDGVYTGSHPGNSEEAIALVENLQLRGANYLVFPATGFWWLEHYDGLCQHLNTKGTRIWSDDSCIVYCLSRDESSPA